ncbi:mitochondrial 54S ribosomal protein mL61 SKDI_11G0530 [Saccharomyces kudriavzevii IFO 1802]|uniref:MRP49-like protein n=2 Tax=Saccharomyces kudriavzevii (strain ATCC MYA-4449 / AS 2.2408 / CBS 8840 / NBRC 1802 / NCYC 2889) TaxID=226230 RepID=J6EEJ1_SACK1|nr:uncharacterized protein SKDI_11G0530 [Saccharomyces kudriavzevii IFO 1802]EJT42569.1 MRP49-like protein [Saccharomyces kudriavzevii IFO 1802]CAI4044471.1 hypothetical protein SKDI_11G0530 [Saccharomyces kudriavzevii IFO 1802]
MSKVTEQLKFLNKISSTTNLPQILIDPKKYSGLRLTFQTKNHNGHMGARVFWHNYLPTLQFYNPRIKFDVVRIKNEDKQKSVPCKLEILCQEGSVTETIDMRNKMHEDIMRDLLDKIEHIPLPESEVMKVPSSLRSIH